MELSAQYSGFTNSLQCNEIRIAMRVSNERTVAMFTFIYFSIQILEKLHSGHRLGVMFVQTLKKCRLMLVQCKSVALLIFVTFFPAVNMLSSCTSAIRLQLLLFRFGLSFSECSKLFFSNHFNRISCTQFEQNERP